MTTKVINTALTVITFSSLVLLFNVGPVLSEDLSFTPQPIELPTGASVIFPYRINKRGQILAESLLHQNPDGSWTTGVSVYTKGKGWVTTSIPDGHQLWEERIEINDKGTVAGLLVQRNVPGYPLGDFKPFLIKGGKLKVLSKPDGANYFGVSRITNKEEFLLSTHDPQVGLESCSIVRNEAIEPLSLPTELGNPNCVQLNDKGVVIGTALIGGETKGFVFDTKQKTFEALPLEFQEPIAINNKGIIAGYGEGNTLTSYNYKSKKTSTYKYNPDEFDELVTITGISLRGVGVGQAQSTSYREEAIYLPPGGSARLLRDLVPEGSVLKSYNDWFAVDINPKGNQILVAVSQLGYSAVAAEALYVLKRSKKNK